MFYWAVYSILAFYMHNLISVQSCILNPGASRWECCMDITLNFIGFNETLHIAISIVMAYLWLEVYTLTCYSFGQDPEWRNHVNGSAGHNDSIHSRAGNWNQWSNRTYKKVPDFLFLNNIFFVCLHCPRRSLVRSVLKHSDQEEIESSLKPGCFQFTWESSVVSDPDQMRPRRHWCKWQDFRSPGIPAK